SSVGGSAAGRVRGRARLQAPGRSGPARIPGAVAGCPREREVDRRSGLVGDLPGRGAAGAPAYRAHRELRSADRRGAGPRRAGPGHHQPLLSVSRRDRERERGLHADRRRSGSCPVQVHVQSRGNARPRLGARPLGSSAARGDLLATEDARRFVMTTMISDLATAYFQLRELDLELEISQRTLVSRQGSLKLVQNRYQGGVSALIDVRQAEVLLYTAAETVPDVERRIEQTENLISLLLGRNPGPVLRGRSTAEQLALAPPSVPAGLTAR